ncbi:MAG: hypothetical protein H7301_00400 [Cryobacterium sp.]|nr:hypothetical protein [Oligoflexia bacterium]
MRDMAMTSQFTYLGIFFGLLIVGGIFAVLYRLNTGIRRGMKKTGDDRKIEKDIQAGDTLHAEGIYGTRHHEGGLPLRQEYDGRSVESKAAGLIRSKGTIADDSDDSSSSRRNTPYAGEKI